MKIAVIGAGNVGSTLGRLWDERGHEVSFGVRDSNSGTVNALRAGWADVVITNVAEAVALAEVVVIAVPGTVVGETVSSGNWSGKIVVDTTNRFGASNEFQSASEEMAQKAPGSRVVKAFNTIGYERYSRPTFGAERASMFLCGDDDDAKSVVAGLTEELGFEHVDCGPLANAGMLESLARLWIHLARDTEGRNVGFRLLRG